MSLRCTIVVQTGADFVREMPSNSGRRRPWRDAEIARVRDRERTKGGSAPVGPRALHIGTEPENAEQAWVNGDCSAPLR